MSSKKEKQLSFGYIKTEGIGNNCEKDVKEKIAQADLKVVLERDILVDYFSLRKHQPILFDLDGGLDDVWKIQGAARLIGSTVRGIVVVGEDAIAKLFRIKLEIRRKYALPCEFDRILGVSYPNFMHAADNKEQVEQDIRVLVPDLLQFCIETNGSHQIKDRVW